MTHELEPTLRALFAAQRFAVLGTQGAEGPLVNLMAVAVTEDLRGILLATERATLKYTNLREHPRVALLVDNRANQADDTAQAVALTAQGVAQELAGSQREAARQVFITRHPQMAAFVDAPTCALFRVRVGRYELVSGLYDVRSLTLD
jgi:nitroimidazol reductase NimA-like FMN-containing flavoprotein (pyridoxamine 5'-phosphate oxidase superfamily)